MCVPVLGKGRRAKEADGNVFFAIQERLLNPCLLEQGWLREESVVGVGGGG